MTNVKTILIASSTILGAASIAGAASALDLSKIPGTTGGAGQYYGIADYRSGNVRTQTTSQGTPPAVKTGVQTGTEQDQYGVADVKTGAAMTNQTSMGATGVPAENQLSDHAGIAGMKAAAKADDSVMSKNGNVIGKVEKVEAHAKYDTIYVRTSNKLDTTVSVFKVNVPKTATSNDTVTLGWTVSQLLTSLEGQVDMRS